MANSDPIVETPGAMGAVSTAGGEKTASTPPKKAGFWGRHPIDIRFSLPFLGGRFYVAALSGRERRPAERRAQERHHYPLRTAANVFFVLGLGAAFYALALVLVAFASAIVEW
ncbi:MAG: hypothetical protein AAB223_02290 [Pseudomonadota bacterium]